MDPASVNSTSSAMLSSCKPSIQSDCYITEDQGRGNGPPPPPTTPPQSAQETTSPLRTLSPELEQRISVAMTDLVARKGKEVEEHLGRQMDKIIQEKMTSLKDQLFKNGTLPEILGQVLFKDVDSNQDVQVKLKKVTEEKKTTEMGNYSKGLIERMCESTLFLELMDVYVETLKEEIKKNNSYVEEVDSMFIKATEKTIESHTRLNQILKQELDLAISQAISQAINPSSVLSELGQPKEVRVKDTLTRLISQSNYEEAFKVALDEGQST